jgi:hypothetical protein
MVQILAEGEPSGLPFVIGCLPTGIPGGEENECLYPHPSRLGSEPTFWITRDTNLSRALYRVDAESTVITLVPDPGADTPEGFIEDTQ